MSGYEYHWHDRIKLGGEAAPFAEDSITVLERFITSLQLPEVLLMLGVGIIVYFMLYALGQKIIGYMALTVAIFSGLATLLEGLTTFFKGGF